MTISYLTGGVALSEFRLQRLAKALASTGFSGKLLDVRDFYLAEWEQEADEEALLRLIPDADESGLPASGAPVNLYVVPRIGTLSPWSSKATDIARVCGLAGLRRVERGRVLALETRPDAAGLACVHDRMTESILDEAALLAGVFAHPEKRPLRRVPLLKQGKQALTNANRDWGLALSDDEIDYLADFYLQAGRDPSDAELMMFGQVNSEHCRHKIFNASWEIDGESMPHSLFAMIRMTHAAAPEGVLSAYSDNSAVIAGPECDRFQVGAGRRWIAVRESAPILMKVETHNHPTAISPHPGAGTGAGGEIRDEAATGRGGSAKAGLCGFSVSNLNLPGAQRPWEQVYGRPEHVASALQIMLEGPIGAAAYNNEFGRPNLCGYFRSFEQEVGGEVRGYHKPIMIAGGMGNLRPLHVDKQPVVPEALLIVLGGPAMLIGLGGGAASSLAGGQGREELDFASVQRANPEMQRRCQEVVDACRALGASNPILSIHDVGAGGLSNALPELVDADGLGAQIDLASIPCADPSLSPMELWCNESQERYVLAVRPEFRDDFAALCARERCPWAVVGRATGEANLVVGDDEAAVDMPMQVLLGKPPRMHREVQRRATLHEVWDRSGISFGDAVQRVLRLPGVAAKGFLISIGDRTVGGMTCRDQYVGPWQTPVADVAVTASGYTGYTGEAMAMGERTPLALLNGPASGRMAVTEAVTNIMAADVASLSDIRLSANWMAPAGHAGEDAVLYDTVRAVGAELCTKLGIAIPVGKDSMSMRMAWQHGDEEKSVTAPVSLVVSAFAPVLDVRRTLTPELRLDSGPTLLLLLDISGGHRRLGGSALAQVYGRIGSSAPDVDDPEALSRCFALMRNLREQNLVLACHDRSDGGLFVTLCEMAFASRCGLEVDLGEVEDPLAAAFAEEAGLVIQVAEKDLQSVLQHSDAARVAVSVVARPVDGERIAVLAGGRTVHVSGRTELQRIWAETSWRIQALRDDPQCAQEEYDQLLNNDDPGLVAEVPFLIRPPATGGKAPRVAILREQGVNGHREMAWAFHHAGFEAVDVHMSELLSGTVALDGFQGLAACGGFSYGDVLGAGRGWAQSILLNDRAREAFAAFFTDARKFALGVCNGCQMMSALKSLIPGAENWPEFVRNRSEQFEARFSQVEILDSPSILLTGMAGTRVPIAVAHGEGRAAFESETDRAAPVLRYVNAWGSPAQRYPQNPNGSPEGATGFTAADGRVTIMMPHPERVVRSVTNSWHPDEWGEDSPWMQLFYNARHWVAQN